MSISAALSSALSGLTAASHRAEVVSSNVANASTPGYGRRTAELAGRMVDGSGAGVQVAGVRREVDTILLGDRRLADASLAAAATRAEGMARLETAIGVPGEPGALGARIDALEAALVTAASRPDSTVRLAAVRDAAGGLADGLRGAGDAAQRVRADADRAIAADVGLLNDALSRVQDLNGQIRRMQAVAGDANALMDERQRLVDGVSAIVPLRSVDQGKGQVALFTAGGAVLLDGRAREIGFTPAGRIGPGTTAAGGGLSGLTLDGRAVATDAGGPLSGGRLGAGFALRDEIAPRAQTALDGLARDLVDRLAGADATLPTGAPGLLIDGGPADPGADTGLAARLRINPAADPAQGGDLWRLRAGLGAPGPGPAGEGAGLAALADALGAPRVPAGADPSSAPRSASGLAADLGSRIAQERLAAEADEGFAAARQSALQTEERARGVDTDAEMAELLRIEQAFGANARVLQTIDDLIQVLLRS